MVALSPLAACCGGLVRRGGVSRGDGRAVAPCCFLAVVWCVEGGSIVAMVALSPLAAC
jgi:hypothetical protein